MTRTIETSFRYDVPPQVVWSINTQYTYFQRLMRGLVTFGGMPSSGQIEQGDILDLKVRLFGWMPPMDYRIELLECDHAAFRFKSLETGGSVKSWLHSSQVVADGDGCILTDTVEIDAGLLTYPTSLWGKYVYRHRHTPRCAIIDEWTTEVPA